MVRLRASIVSGLGFKVYDVRFELLDVRFRM